jgi:ketosteroid isomerase-like protein
MLLQGIRLGFEATNRRDFELLLARYHPDAETHHHPETHELAYEPILRGREGVLRFFEQWFAEWQQVQYEPVELVDPGGNRFMVLSEIVGKGRESGAPARQEFAQLFELQDGWIIRVDAWMGPWEEALGALRRSLASEPQA